MNIKNNIIMSSIIFTILTGCSSGNDNTSSQSIKPNNSGTVINVDSSKQKNTPLSIKVSKLVQNGFNTNNCFALESMEQGKNYKVETTSNPGYSTLSLTYNIMNICNTAESGDIVAKIKNFKINNNYNDAVYSYALNTGTPYYTVNNPIKLNENGDYSINMLAPNCVGDYCSWAEIPANSTKSFTLIYAVYGPISNYSIDSLSLDNNPTPPIQKPGKIQLNLDTKNISDICNKGLCNFAINLKSNGFESIINFDNTQDTYTIQNLNAGNYTFSVTNIPGDINIEFQPKDTISVSPNNISNETIVFKHAEPSKINLTVKLNNIDDKEASSLKPILKLIDINNSKYNANCIITIGNICTFNNMKANDTYQINLQGVGNASSGNYYTYTGESFVLNSSITKEISYDKVTNNLKSVTFLVNGLNSDATTPNVVFTEDDEGSNFLYAQNQLNSGTYTFVIDHNIAINPVDTPNGYTFESVTPNMIHVDNNPNQVIVNYSKNSPTPPTKGGILAGYLSTGYMGPSNNYVTIGQAAQIGYNVVILAFAKVDDSENISFYNNGGIGILAYDNGIGSSKCINDATQYMINDIKTAKEKYNLKYVLASFGGGNSTISRSSFNNIDILAANMITFKNKYHLDGFDFDLEIQIDANNLDQLLKKLKKLDPSIILSAAPQMNTIDPTAKNKYLVDLVTTGYYQDYDIAVNNGDFDYIWAQAYNTGSATNLIKYSNNDIDETMSDYIIAAFSYFTTNQAGNNYIKIPNNTTFILGEPATKEDAGVATVWNNNQYSDVYNALLNGYSKLSSPNAMTWTINRDISIGNCKFTKTLSPLITGKQIPDSLCPTNTDKYWANVCSNN